MDEALEESAKEMHMKWDRQKDWQGPRGKHFGVYLQDRNRHWRERLNKARVVWASVRRLTRLPAKCKKQLVCGHLLPMLTYGAEAYTELVEEIVRLDRQWSRRGASARRVEELSGIEELGDAEKENPMGSVCLCEGPYIATYYGKRSRLNQR